MTTASTPDPLALIQSGKVRELYDAGGDRLLMVASDRISAFDVVMAEPIPDKGRVLTAMTAYWLEELADLAPNHLVSADVADFPDGAATLPGGLGYLAGRSMLVRRAEMLDIECIVRGYLAGSAFKEYEKEGTVHGMAMPAGLRHADRLPEPIFTPSTKATEGHDLNIGMAEAVDLVGQEAAEAASALCLAAYSRAAARAESQGIVICDTKFELGFIDGTLSICDEVLTPDSSRFWPAEDCAPGTNPPSFDKQRLRDWLGDTALGQAAAAPGAARRGRVGHVGPVRRVLRAGLRPTPGRLVRCLSMARSAPVPAQFSVLVEVRLREGVADPQGATIERALPALGLGGVSGVRAGQVVPLRHRGRRRGRGPGPGHRGGRPAAGQPGHRGVLGDREPGGGRGGGVEGLMAARVGVVMFPGTNCEHDAVLALQRLGASAELVWHGDTTVAGYDALVLPGGFAHGDYLRPGAIARFSPIMEAVGRFAAAGGPVVGICNGFQVLTEAGLLPGRPPEEPRASASCAPRSPCGWSPRRRC